MAGKKVLIVYAHQEPKSLNGSLKTIAVEELSKQGCSVAVSDLYEMQFEPRTTKKDIVGNLYNPEEFNYGVEAWEAWKNGSLSEDLIEEQKKVKEADLVIFQFPLYWFSMPAIMKGWMDRVLVQGFAHDFPKCYDSGLLKNKLALLSFTTGGDKSMYSDGGVSGDIRYLLWPMQICFAPEYATQDERRQMVACWRQRLRIVWEEEPINCTPEWYYKLTWQEKMDYSATLKEKTTVILFQPRRSKLAAKVPNQGPEDILVEMSFFCLHFEGSQSNILLLKLWASWFLMKSEDLLQKEQLDVGGFGMVSLCYHKNHGLVVLKTVYTGPQRTDCNTSLLEEGKIMQKLNHDRVVKLLGVILEDGNYSLVMEYVRRGNLMSVLKATTIPLSVKGRFILEIIEGMLYLTEQGLVHKDLKPENILVDEDFHIKIADLGVACFKNWSKLTKEETSRQRKIKYSSKSNAGTLFYMAPEHLRDINTTPVEKSDVYSFGIVLWSIFANKEPYENAVNDMQVYFCIINGDRPLKTKIEENCPAEVIALMEQAWKQEPEERPTFAEIYLTYKPFYQDNLEQYVEEDVRRIKEIYPEPLNL
ncbi:hypothetical protein JRQ81_012377 [Phrynocephalus forsythii]|uniref:Ribosyldihydronicotinamide dehydrogenase [quinone] n=1 Tax=Phrynocephalus forsythii TaxID=171643 RepID=A0A9Q0Y109_9SAUR|nr:hypothetical protein JRQ81_012377 [Phrynocephalus forsythii]